MKDEPKTVEDMVQYVNEKIVSELAILPRQGNHLVNEKLDFISTQHPDINKALGLPGLPKGRIVEVSGMEASGKSTFVLHVIAEAQKLGGNCALIDTEHAIDKNRAQQIGVRFDDLLISQPDNAEQALELLDTLVRSGLFSVVVLDSVAAMSPQAEVEGEMQDSTIGVLARLMGKLLRKVAAPANKTKTLVLFTNQLRDKIGGFSSIPMKTTPGGNALKFYATIRIEMARTKNNKSGDKLISTQHKVTIKKNKIAPPMGTTSVKIAKNGWLI